MGADMDGYVDGDIVGEMGMGMCMRMGRMEWRIIQEWNGKSVENGHHVAN